MNTLGLGFRLYLQGTQYVSTNNYTEIIEKYK